MLALLALQQVYDDWDYWGLYGRSAGGSIIEISVGVLPVVLPLAVLVRSRSRNDGWLRSLRLTFWVMLIVAVLPAYWGAMTTLI
jgi:hypothetical protein